MKLFRISPFVQGRNRMKDFLRDCFVSPGYPGIGDLEHAGEAEVSKRLNRVYGYEGNALRQALAEVDTFARGMADGDYAVVRNQGNVWLGDLGDYYYRDDYDSPEEATCHRRGVTWLGVLPHSALNPLLRRFVAEDADEEGGPIAVFPLPADLAGLELFAAQTPGGAAPGLADVPERRGAQVDDETVREAIAALREMLRSADPELRLRAAEALLKYAK